MLTSSTEEITGNCLLGTNFECQPNFSRDYKKWTKMSEDFELLKVCKLFFGDAMIY